MTYGRLTDIKLPPSDADMTDAIGAPLAEAWTELRRFLVATYEIEPILQYGGKRYSWNVQHRKGGRPLCEMYPEHGAFTAMVVLGKKELDEALDRSKTFEAIVRQRLTGTPRHPDGRWLYIQVTDP